jgi:ATP-dependent protease ClpP protease subunit
MSIEATYGPDSALLTLMGALDQRMALELRRLFRTAVNYYHYKRIEIEIQSPGGETQAMKALAAEMQWLRVRGCTVATTGMLEAASAAAVTLALGDVGFRTVQPYTNLLFHHARVIRAEEHVMTAAEATAAAQQLEAVNAAVIAMVIQHVIDARGSAQKVAEIGLDRCHALKVNAELLLQELGIDASMPVRLGTEVGKGWKGSSWINSVIRAYETTIKSGKSSSLTKLLMNIFAVDKRMPLEMAWTLQLIDKVEGTTLLVPDVAPSPGQVTAAVSADSNWLTGAWRC